MLVDEPVERQRVPPALDGLTLSAADCLSRREVPNFPGGTAGRASAAPTSEAELSSASSKQAPQKRWARLQSGLRSSARC